jgi:hypothetical protein
MEGHIVFWQAFTEMKIDFTSHSRSSFLWPEVTPDIFRESRGESSKPMADQNDQRKNST